jgi:hypothetical protein
MTNDEGAVRIEDGAARRTRGGKVAVNYVWGFMLFWGTGLCAELAGNLITANGSVAGWAGVALQIIFLTLIIWWAIRRKIRGIVPGVCIGVAMQVATMIWIEFGR